MKDLDGTEELMAEKLRQAQRELGLTDEEMAYFLLRIATDYYLKTMCKGAYHL